MEWLYSRQDAALHTANWGLVTDILFSLQNPTRNDPEQAKCVLKARKWK